MILCELLETNHNEWEERVAAATFLRGAKRLPDSFDVPIQVKVNVLLQRLSILPECWAKELCWDVLQLMK